MTHVDRLLTLFRAFRERNDDAFYRAAEAIIADELAANHHAQARDLQKALENGEKPTHSRSRSSLAVLPKDRRYGEPLVSLSQPHLDSPRVILHEDANTQITRILQEHGHRQKLAKFGYSPKTKLLFWGPPGCGKTLTAHWLASELGLPIAVVRLDALITSYVGETASHVQRVFDLAQSTPMVLLLDEADAIGKDRDDRNDIGELKRVVNSLLQAMDSFRSTESLVVFASNHQYLFDAALWRRFDDLVHFPLPSYNEAKIFIATLLNGVAVTGSFEAAARAASSLSFAQIEKEVVEAVKSKILEDRAAVVLTDVASQFRKRKLRIRSARRKNPLKPRRNE